MNAMMASMWSSPDTQYILFAFGMQLVCQVQIIPKYVVDDLCSRTESMSSAEEGKAQREETEKHAHDTSAIMASMWSSPETQYFMFAFGMPIGMPNID